MRRVGARVAVAMAVIAAATGLFAGAAAAHTDVEAVAADQGRTRISLSPEQECGSGQLATVGLRVQLPQGATDIQPVAEPGWTIDVTATEVGWASPTGADKPTFTVEMVLAEPAGSTVYLPAIQQCPGGEEIVWIQIPSTPGEYLQRPAPSFVVPSNSLAPSTTAPSTTTSSSATTEPRPTTGEGESQGPGDSGNGVYVFALIAVVIVVAAGGVSLFLRYRNHGPGTDRGR